MLKKNIAAIQMRLNIAKGFGLIEVMIAASILTVSLLGVAAVQTRSISASNESSNRETAMRLLTQISNFIINSEENELSSLFSVAAKDCIQYSSSSAGCSKLELATAVATNWKSNISRIFPQGEGCFCLVNNGEPVSDIIQIRSAIKWTSLSGEKKIAFMDSKFLGEPPDNYSNCPNNGVGQCNFSS